VNGSQTSEEAKQRENELLHATFHTQFLLKGVPIASAALFSLFD